MSESSSSSMSSDKLTDPTSSVEINSSNHSETALVREGKIASLNEAPPVTPQQLTIQDAFDPEDNATVHAASNNWLPAADKNTKLWVIGQSANQNSNSNNSDMAAGPASSNSSGSKTGFNKLFPLNKLGNTNEDKKPLKPTTNNFNFFSSNFLNLTLKQRGQNQQQQQQSIVANLSKSRTSSYLFDLNNSSSSNYYRSSLSKYKGSSSSTASSSMHELKYMDYKRKWTEYLKKEKKIFDAKWTGAASTGLIQPTPRLEDFELKKTLGNGSFGRVILAKHKSSGKYYALKVLIKKNVIKSRQVEHTLNEKKITNSVSFPFIAAFVSSFKDTTNLYIVLEFVPGGEMFKHLVRLSKFSEWQTKFYCAQVILAIEYLHSLDILHRDLKPENTLISQDGYIKISDFGFAKYVKTRTYTLCGTPEYLAPEIIQSKPYGKAVDWWSVGILTYEMSTGRPPFQSDQPIKIYEKILACKYKAPQSLSEDLRDFMRCLIQPDVTKRYGCLRNGVDDVKLHKWFSGLDWMAVYNKKLAAPMIPKVKHPGDASNFDSFSEEAVTIGKDMLFEKEFADF